MPDTLHGFLADELRRRGWSRRELAARADTSPNTIARVVRGEGVPDTETIRKIADALGLDELPLLRLAGHVEAPPVGELDPSAAYIAQRISALPRPIREQALDAIGAQLDAIYEIAAMAAPAGSGKTVEALEAANSAIPQEHKVWLEALALDEATHSYAEELRALRKRDPEAFELRVQAAQLLRGRPAVDEPAHQSAAEQGADLAAG